MTFAVPELRRVAETADGAVLTIFRLFASVSANSVEVATSSWLAAPIPVVAISWTEVASMSVAVSVVASLMLPLVFVTTTLPVGAVIDRTARSPPALAIWMSPETVVAVMVSTEVAMAPAVPIRLSQKLAFPVTGERRKI